MREEVEQELSGATIPGQSPDTNWRRTCARWGAPVGIGIEYVRGVDGMPRQNQGQVIARKPHNKHLLLPPCRAKRLRDRELREAEERKRAQKEALEAQVTAHGR